MLSETEDLKKGFDKVKIVKLQVPWLKQVRFLNDSAATNKNMQSILNQQYYSTKLVVKKLYFYKGDPENKR